MSDGLPVAIASAWSVLPHGSAIRVFFLIGGIIFVVFPWFVEDHSLFMRPLTDPLSKRVVFSGAGLMMTMIGYGLLCKSRAALFGLLAYIIGGSIQVGIMNANPVEPDVEISEPGMGLFGIAFNILLAAWFVWTTRTVFFSSKDVPVSTDTRIQ